MLLRLKSARVDYEKNLKPCNKKLEDEKFDKKRGPSLTEYNFWHSFLFRQRQTQVRPSSDLGVDDVICSTSSTKYEGVKKIEVVTVFELNAYVVNSTPHVKSLTVSSSILAGATYPALMGSLPACSDLTSVGVVRYRVELCILDGTESAVFVVFYAEISWLTNVRAAEISELMGVGVGDCRGRASDELNSVRIIAEEQQLPGAGCPLKKARTELLLK
ncbi:BnaA07g02100D [Brassica napus]|uniref:BnaA07g02100D protein n=1 Tax=Brassica napus TaxID=3708 RepID=A0A078HMY5_BRANA|nr:BnaA07g02100D [Brassica napus]